MAAHTMQCKMIVPEHTNKQDLLTDTLVLYLKNTLVLLKYYSTNNFYKLLENENNFVYVNLAILWW